MIEEFLASGTLNIIYAVVVSISFIFALLALLGAEVTDALDFDIDGEGEVSFVSISPFAMAMFGAAFGMTGLITRLWLDMEAIPSILWASGMGLLVGGLAQVFFFYVLSPSKSSHYRLADDGIGREAEVIITIPEAGLGTIAFDNVSGRVTLGARSATDQPIARGKFVIIERITGRVAVVRPVDSGDGNP
jgi:membrane protein implicated in regulation of membrane protease activity